MEKTKVLNVYRRYLKSLSDPNASIGTNVSSIFQWFSKNVENEKLSDRLKLDAIYQALRVVEARQLSCKRAAGNTWDEEGVKKFYRMLDNLNQALKLDDDPRARVITVSLRDHMTSFINESPWVALYMWHKYSSTYAGSWLTKHREMMKEHQDLLDELATEETEAEARLAVQGQIMESARAEG